LAGGEALKNGVME